MQENRRGASSKVRVFLVDDQAHYAATAFAAGAHGYVLKAEGTERVLEAIELVMRGGRYLSEQIAAKAPGLVPGLGPRGRTRKSQRAISAAESS